MRSLVILMTTTALLAACGDDTVVRDPVEIQTEAGETSGGPLKVVDTLQCPQTQGSLTRKGTASGDGMTCTYLGPRGSEVVLTLVKLNGREPKTVLQELETRLGQDMPQAIARLRALEAEKAAANAESSATGAQAEAGATSGGRANISMPGINIEADGNNAKLQIGPIKIDAQDDSADINISTGDASVSVQAHDDVAEVRTQQTGSGVRSTYVLAHEDASPGGLRMVGYQARGPQAGPLVIATVRSKDRESDGLMDDAEALVTLNVGE